MGTLETVTTDNAEHSIKHRKALAAKYFLTSSVCQYVVEKMLNNRVIRTPHSDTRNTVSEYKDDIYSHINQSFGVFQDSI